MITFTELLRRAKREEIAVHTATEAQALTLLTELDKKGYVWGGGGGMKLTATTYYEDEEENTCYNFGLDKEVWYDSRSYCQEAGYTIIEFGDIDFKEKK